jgi:hypothetical protein
VFNTVCDISKRRKRFQPRKDNPEDTLLAFKNKAYGANDENGARFIKGKPRSIYPLENL